jgi:hypothetical protein
MRKGAPGLATWAKTSAARHSAVAITRVLARVHGVVAPHIGQGPKTYGTPCFAQYINCSATSAGMTSGEMEQPRKK